MPRHITISDPTRIPVPGGKLIEEYLGRVRTGQSSLSLAHMVAPPGWGEPAQSPEFDEITIMIRGRMRIEVEGEVVELAAGSAFFVERGAKVRYSNPFDEESEYWAVCVPAFSPELAHRDPDA